MFQVYNPVFKDSFVSYFNVAKCNLGKVKFKTMPVSGRPTLRLRGDLLSSLLGVPRTELNNVCACAGLRAEKGPEKVDFLFG